MLSSVIHRDKLVATLQKFVLQMITTYMTCMNRLRKLFIVWEFESDIIITLLFRAVHDFSKFAEGFNRSINLLELDRVEFSFVSF